MNETVQKSINTLGYLIEVNKKSRNLESLEFVDVNVSSRGEINARLLVKGFCEDPDMGAFNHIIDAIDTDIYNVINQYEFTSQGKLKKGEGSLMFFFDSVNWKFADGTVTLGYYLHQSEFEK